MPHNLRVGSEVEFHENTLHTRVKAPFVLVLNNKEGEIERKAHPSSVASDLLQKEDVDMDGFNNGPTETKSFEIHNAKEEALASDEGLYETEDLAVKTNSYDTVGLDDHQSYEQETIDKGEKVLNPRRNSTFVMSASYQNLSSLKGQVLTPPCVHATDF
jgi:hypothetical protein